MAKKVLTAALVVIALVLVVDVVYIGTIFFSGKKQQSPIISDGNGTVSLYNPYNVLSTTQSADGFLASPYNPQTPMPTQAVQQPGNVVQPSAENDPINPTDVPVNEPTDPSAYSLEQTVTAMQNAVAYLKSAQNFTALKYQIPKIEIKALSISWLQSAAQGIVNQFVDPVSLTYVFRNGVADDPETKESDPVVTPAQAIPPADIAFRIDPAGVTGYNVTQNADGSTTYTVAIREENCNLTTPPYYHAMCMDYVNLDDYDISPARVNYADIIYHEATVSVTVNSAGIPTSMREYMPVSASGEGSLLGVSATASLSGSLDETWTFSW